MELEIIDDAVGTVQSNPSMYLQTEEARAYQLVSSLASDATILEAFPVVIDRIAGWWVVAAEQDWLIKGNEFPPEISFRRIVPFPEAGQNSIRSEILLTAFADRAVTYRGGERLVITGDEKELEELEVTLRRHYRNHRIVAFRM